MQPLTIHMDNCARCGRDGGHTLTFMPLRYPIIHQGKVLATHWAICPIEREPVILRSISDDEDDDD